MMSKREIISRSIDEMRIQYKRFLKRQAEACTKDDIEVAVMIYNDIFTEIKFLNSIGVLSLRQMFRLEDIFRNAFRRLMNLPAVK